MLKWFRKHCFQWQFYWKPHISYKCYEDEDYGLFDHVLCITFFQLRWTTSAIEVSD